MDQDLCAFHFAARSRLWTPGLWTPGLWTGGLYTSSQPFVREPDHFVYRLLQLAVDREHGDAVHGRPDILRQLERVVWAHHSVFLLRDDRAHEYLEGARAFAREIRLWRGIADVSAEHHPVMRRVRHGEFHVGFPHRLEASLPSSMRVPRFLSLQAQRSESLRGDRREQRRLVGEMAVQRRARDAELRADAAHGERRHPLFLDRA